MNTEHKILQTKLIILLLFGLIICTLFYYVYQKENVTELLVVFLDVGQGDAIYIRAPNGNDVLIDTGPSAQILASLSRYKSFLDNTIDMVIVTHDDLDHVGGLSFVLKRYDVGVINEVLGQSDKDIFTGIVRNYEHKNTQQKNVLLLAGDVVVIDVLLNIYLEVLYPFKNHQTLENFFDGNDTSRVIRLVYGEQSFLFNRGIFLYKIEQQLVQKYGNSLQSDILKVAHHGSKTSSSIPFLKSVSPDHSVIQVESESRFGHPHPVVVNRLHLYGGEVFSTATSGDVVYRIFQ